MDASRGSGSRRVHDVIDGRATVVLAKVSSDMNGLRGDGESRRNGGRLQIEREVERGQDLADLLDAGEIHRADLRQLERIGEHGLDEPVIPYLALVRTDGQEDRLWRSCAGLLEVE